MSCESFVHIRRVSLRIKFSFYNHFSWRSVNISLSRISRWLTILLLLLGLSILLLLRLLLIVVDLGLRYLRLGVLILLLEKTKVR